MVSICTFLNYLSGVEKPILYDVETSPSSPLPSSPRAGSPKPQESESISEMIPESVSAKFRDLNIGPLNCLQLEFASCRTLFNDCFIRLLMNFGLWRRKDIAESVQKVRSL